MALSENAILVVLPVYRRRLLALISSGLPQEQSLWQTHLLVAPRPSKLEPPRALLVRDHLRLPVLPQERLIARAEAARAPRQARARPDGGRAGVRAVVARPDPTAVEVLGAICGRGSPFADDDPKIEGGQVSGVGTSGGNVLLVGTGDLLQNAISERNRRKRMSGQQCLMDLW